MNALKNIILIFFGFIVLCCGLGTLVTPSSSSNRTSSGSSTNKSSATPSASSQVADTSRESTSSAPSAAAKRVFEKRLVEYEHESDQWAKRQTEREEMQQSLKSIAQQLDDHEDEKPSMPTYAARTWSTLDRKYTTVATLVEFDGENALIKNADGKESFVPKSKLIAEDRVYLDSILEATQHFESWRATGIELATELAKTKATLDLGIGPKPQKPDLASIDKELIDAEKRRIAAAETLRIEAAAKAKADKLNQAKKNAAEELELFATILAVADPTQALVTGVRSKGDEVIVTVSNGWHYQPYQIRLQIAQNLWQGWANIHSPHKPDSARLSVVVLNDNKVGGSRVWGGSLIWVQEE